MTTLNFWPILVSAIVSFVIGALWYSPILFGREWMELSKISDDDMRSAKEKGVTKLYVAQFILSLVSWSVLAFIISSVEGMSASDGAFIGLIVWIGFVATDALSKVMWEKKPFKLALIGSVGMLLNMVVSGAIMGAWR